MLSTLLLSSPDYKSFLRNLAEQQSHVKAIHSKMAEAAGCQKSYFSKVLNGEAHLLPDHAYGIAEFLHMSEPETDYFLELVQLDRAGSPKLRQRQKRTLEKLKQQMENLHQRFRSESLNEEEEQKIYYSSWMYSAIHIACGIEGLRTVKTLASRFHLEPKRVEAVLLDLARMKLLEEQNGKWQRSPKHLHIPFGSPMNSVNHTNWSVKALQDIQLEKEDSLHYTAAYSLEKKDVDQIKHILIQAIERSREVVKPSHDEELVCLRVDLFRP